MLFLASTLAGWIQGDFVYRKWQPRTGSVEQLQHCQTVPRHYVHKFKQRLKVYSLIAAWWTPYGAVAAFSRVCRRYVKLLICLFAYLLTYNRATFGIFRVGGVLYPPNVRDQREIQHSGLWSRPTV